MRLLVLQQQPPPWGYPAKFPIAGTKVKRILLLISVLVLCLGQIAHATAPSMCLFTGSIADIYGTVGKPVRVTYQGVATQNAGSNIIPGDSQCSIYTDNAGNLPSTGTCSSFVQGALLQVTVGEGQPIQIQVPIQTSADLSTLILANTDPPSIVSQISIGVGGDYVLTVTNPSAGTVGQAILGPGNVTGWAGQPIPTGVPTSGAIPYYTAGPTAGWQFSRSGSYTPVPLCAGFTPSLYANASASPQTGQGYWIQVGNMVYVQGNIVWAVATNTATANALAMISLPFTPVGLTNESGIDQNSMAHGNLWNLEISNVVVNPPIPTGTPPGLFLAIPGIQTIATQFGGVPTATSSIPVGQIVLFGPQYNNMTALSCAGAFPNQPSVAAFSGWYRIF